MVDRVLNVQLVLTEMRKVPPWQCYVKTDVYRSFFYAMLSSMNPRACTPVFMCLLYVRKCVMNY